MTRRLPGATKDLELAKQDMDAYGYCLLKDALNPGQVAAA